MVDAFVRYIKKCGVEIIHDKVTDITLDDASIVNGVLTEKNGSIYASSVILATGGMSYQATGSTGDGYRFAENLGHTVTDIIPSLVPVEVEEFWAYQLMGVSLKNIEVTVFNENNKKIYDDFG